MSIYINGMKMPKSKPTCIIIDQIGQVRRYDLNNDKYEDDELFEAVPVPPHGDLIDKQYAYQNTMAMGEHMRKIILKQIDLLPTIIPADEGET